jgi:peptide-methionine (S)-S-oxide reductase
MKKGIVSLLCLGGVAVFAMAGLSMHKEAIPVSRVGTAPGGFETKSTPASGHELAAFSGGCFWGAEQSYRQLPGVVATAVGYTGGSCRNPDYYQAHQFGHAETVLIEFDPKLISYRDLLKTFWTRPHPKAKKGETSETNPTYRSTIWTFDQVQQKSADASLASQQVKENSKLLTRVEPMLEFFRAEPEHQQHDEKAGFDTCQVD